MEKYVPSSVCDSKIEVMKSIFIATASPAFNIKEAREFIASIKKQYSDATHNVPAFVIGNDATVTTHSSDDGEPSGTAGRPILSVISGSVFTNIAVVVTRYFGGMKLGTGGLVKAYSSSVKNLLDILPKSQIAYVNELEILLPYTCYDRFQILCSDYDADIINTSFSTDVTCKLRILVEKYESFIKDLSNLTSGSSIINIIELSKEVLYPI